MKKLDSEPRAQEQQPLNPRQQKQPASTSEVLVMDPSMTTYVLNPVERKQQLTGHFILSCYVFWCCDVIGGAVAFVLARLYNNE